MAECCCLRLAGTLYFIFYQFTQKEDSAMFYISMFHLIFNRWIFNDWSSIYHATINRHLAHNEMTKKLAKTKGYICTTLQNNEMVMKKIAIIANAVQCQS